MYMSGSCDLSTTTVILPSKGSGTLCSCSSTEYYTTSYRSTLLFWRSANSFAAFPWCQTARTYFAGANESHRIMDSMLPWILLEVLVQQHLDLIIEHKHQRSACAPQHVGPCTLQTHTKCLTFCPDTYVAYPASLGMSLIRPSEGGSKFCHALI